MLPDGSLVEGLEVFRRAYAAVGLGWLLAPTRWPLVRDVAEAGYRLFARNRLRSTGRGRSECASDRCRIPEREPHEHGAANGAAGLRGRTEHRVPLRDDDERSTRDAAERSTRDVAERRARLRRVQSLPPDLGHVCRQVWEEVRGSEVQDVPMEMSPGDMDH